MTKLNLKKAIQIQIGLVKSNNELRTQLLNYNNTQFKETEVVSVKHAAFKRDFNNFLETYTKQVKALFSLRKKVGAANASNNMSEKLTNEAELNAQLEVYAQLSVCTPGQDLNSILAELEALKAMPAHQYGHQALKMVATPIHSAQDIESFKKEVVSIKRKLVSLKDEILYANIATTIDLSVEEEQILESLGLV